MHNVFLITFSLRDLYRILTKEVKVDIDHISLSLKFIVELLFELI